MGELHSLLELSEVVYVPISSKEVVGVLLAHPPRTPLMERVTARTPIRWLSPYVYRGPVDSRLFVGREQALHRLCSMEASHVVVGPRSIGKTSLINRAYQRLRDSGATAIRLEFGSLVDERELSEQFFSALVDTCGVAPSVQRRITVPRLQRLIKRVAQHSTPKRIAIFIDEADLLEEHCPRLAAMLKLLHDHGDARVVLVGYKQLRRAISDSRRSLLMNVYQELLVSRLSLRECGELVVSPMTALGVTLQDPQSIVEAVYHDSGGSPSRIQLLCHSLVEMSEEKSQRQITREDAERAIELPQVRKVLAEWFHQSTSILEKYLAAVAAKVLPCEEERLIEEVRRESPDISVHVLRTEIQDLITADVLDYRHDGGLDFTFPLVKDLARPTGMRKTSLSELRVGAIRAAREQ